MLISHTKKFIFIHNYKVAGTSITKALKPYADYSYQDTSRFKKLMIKAGLYPNIFSRSFEDHITMEGLHTRLPDRIVKSYFKFGFVRDPWDWQVSLYQYMLKLKNHHQHELIKGMRSFDEYIAWRVDGNFQLQKDFFYNHQGNCVVDFIGKYEDLIKDFNYVCNEKIRVSAYLPHLNSSRESKKEYLDYYSQKSIDMVDKAFQQDIVTFGYVKPEKGTNSL